MSASADDLVWYPRAFVRLGTTVQNGGAIDTGIQPSKASVSRRAHNQAGTAEVTIHGSALPFDPRQIGGINVAVYMGAVDTIDADVNTDEFLRFVGYVDTMSRKRDEKGPSVELKIRDMSALLRDFKPIPREAMPRYSDTIETAIVRVLQIIPNCVDPDGTPRITLAANMVTSQAIGESIPPRFRSAALQLPPESTAWQVIEHACGLAGLLVSVRLGEIIVRKPVEVYAHNDPAVATFTFGGETANLLSVADEKKFVRNRKGVKVVSFDPVARQTIEAIYPPDADVLPDRRPRAQLRRTFTTTRRVGPHARAPVVDRDVFDAFGIHTQGLLNKFAERLYLERSQQEIEGTIVTPVWTPNILAMDNADRFTLAIQPELAAQLRNQSSRQAMINLLVQRLDVNEQAAGALIDASVDRPSDTFYTRTVTHEYESDGKSTTTVEFLNLIEVGEAATNA